MILRFTRPRSRNVVLFFHCRSQALEFYFDSLYVLFCAQVLELQTLWNLLLSILVWRATEIACTSMLSHCCDRQAVLRYRLWYHNTTNYLNNVRGTRCRLTWFLLKATRLLIKFLAEGFPNRETRDAIQWLALELYRELLPDVLFQVLEVFSALCCITHGDDVESLSLQL